MSSAERRTAVMRGEEVVSSCCGAEIAVTREVTDIVAYWPERVAPAEGDFPVTLYVRYGKVYEGDAEAYIARCQGCLWEIEIEIDEE